MVAPTQKGTGAIVIGVNELERLSTHVRGLSADMAGDGEIADMVGAQQVRSARRRIEETKRAPSGKRWASWSEKHAATRQPEHSLLIESGDLHDSITHVVSSPLEVQVGSNLAYAATQLYGDPDRRIPQRAFLDTTGGFSDPHDRAEIRDGLRRYWERQAGYR